MSFVKARTTTWGKVMKTDTPPKTNLEPQNGGLEDDFQLQTVNFRGSKYPPPQKKKVSWVVATQIFLEFSPRSLGDMIQFDFCIFFKWVGSTTNKRRIWRVSCTLFQAVLRGGKIPFHRPYPYCLKNGKVSPHFFSKLREVDEPVEFSQLSQVKTGGVRVCLVETRWLVDVKYVFQVYFYTDPPQKTRVFCCSGKSEFAHLPNYLDSGFLLKQLMESGYTFQRDEQISTWLFSTR